MNGLTGDSFGILDEFQMEFLLLDGRRECM
jgi:hypothetical protein